MSPTRRKTQPYKIKGVDALFGEENGETITEQKIPLSKIILSQNQPRRYFDPQTMEELIESIKQHGILQPILVRPTANKSYELIAGERRYRAVQALDLLEIPALVRRLTDEDAAQVALLENLQREDLNPIEETEGILRLLALKIETDTDTIIHILNQSAHPERNSVDNVIHTKEWETLLKVFKAIGRFTPESFRSNRLPLLTLPNEILESVREGKIAYTKARVIGRVKDIHQREELLEAAITEQLSLNEIKERIRNLDIPGSSRKKKLAEKFTKRLTQITRQLKKVEIWNNPKKRKQAEKLLAELEKLTKE